MSTREAATHELRVVLLGGRNSGKSAVGNVLLGREEFVTKERTTCSRRVGEVSGRWVTAVDTPGWWCDFPVQGTPQLVKREILRSISLCSPGPHVFLIIVKASSVFCEKRRRAVEEHLALFNESVWSYCMVVFTCSVCSGNTPIHQQVKRGDSALLWLVEKCSHRYYCLDVKNRGAGEYQVAELFVKMQGLVTKNSDRYFKMDEMFLKDLEEQKQTAEIKAQERLLKMQKQRRLFKGESCHLSNIRVVLHGARQSGKSSVGNTILGGKVFDITRRTAQCEVKAGDIAGRQLTVVDTPGWWMNYFSQDTSAFDRREIVGSVSLCHPGPHAFLLVVRVDRSFTETYRRAVQEHLELISDTIWAHVIVLFNFGDWLGDTTIEQHIESEGPALQWLVETCGNRYHVLNNRSNSGFQVNELLRRIEELVAGSRGYHYEIKAGVLQHLEEKKRAEQKRAAQRMTRAQEQRESSRALMGQLHPPSELRIVLLSGSNTGRSSAGNAILGRQHFDIGDHATDRVEGQEKINGKTVTVLDPPGWLSVCPDYLGPPSATGVTVLLVVVNVSSSYSHVLWRTAEKHLEALGENAWKRTMVLFTFGNWLGNTTIEQHIESEGEALQTLVEKCGNRYHVLDSKSQGTGEQVTELLEKIEEVLVEERLEDLQRGEQVGKSLTAMQDQETDVVRTERRGIEVPEASHQEVPSNGASEIGEQELALPEASGGRTGRANQSILDLEGFQLSMARVLQRKQESQRWNMGSKQTLVLNLSDWLHTGCPQRQYRRQNGQKSVNSVRPLSPGHQALLFFIPVEQPQEPERTPVDQEDITALMELSRTGGLQAAIDQWGSSNLDELESFIDFYFEMVWKETRGSFMAEKQDCFTNNSPEMDDGYGEDILGEGRQKILSSIEQKLSKLDILESMQRDLLELKKSLDHSCSIIQDLSNRRKDRTQELVVPSVTEEDVEKNYVNDNL
ncbi:hypothetical protein UPYG_G00105390 [Umbra pygmaea]|uniref:AIG1-type G domain-containing protein n=1 Tax=Umbra pygmaea TaxID=75934 RepID=A0ABD0XM26_UMBPY